MPSASPRRPDAGPGPRSQDARRPAGNPLRIDLRELGRRAGAMQELERTVPAPPDWRVEMIGVPAGGQASLRLRLESVMEGVLVTGDVEVPVAGSCARCLEPFEDVLELDIQELYAYAGSTTDATSEEDEVRRIDGDFLDLEPLLRDTVVLNLPLAPVCTEDCAGLCVDCGARLDDLPADHTHEVVDARWAALTERFASSPGTPGETLPTKEN